MNLFSILFISFESKQFNDYVCLNFPDEDAVLSIPGSGHHIQQVLNMHTRLHQGLVNLMQMKSILQYMLGMAQSIEQELSTIV